MTNKVMIVGTGQVGASIGYCLINQQTDVNELLLVDTNAADAEGEAMDLHDALVVSPNYLKIHSATLQDATDCDIVVLAAGVAQRPGQTRLDLLSENANSTKQIVQEIMKSGFDGIFIVVSNPMDVLTYLTWHYSGLPSERIIGSGTVLDSARLRFRIAEKLNLFPQDIQAHQIGEHGDSEFSLWSSANISGQPIAKFLTATEQAEIEQSTRDKAYEIIKLKGATFYGIGACITQIINAVLEDQHRALPVASFDDFTEVFYGFPTVIGRAGAIRRLDLKLSESENLKLQSSINIIKSAITSILKP